MLVRIKLTSEAPLHSQIGAQLRLAIANHEVPEGQRLPPARRLADALSVNMHTVLRAYRQLESEGLIDLRRGRGATVQRGAGKRARELLGFADRVFLDAKRKGLSRAQLASLLEGQL